MTRFAASQGRSTGLKRNVLALGAFLAVSLVGMPASAATFSIDSFSVNRDGGFSFFDGFSDGLAPPNAPAFASGAAASYGVFGGPGPEAGGRLTLNTATGGVASNALGVVVLEVQARLLTNTSTAPADAGLGLKPASSFTVSGLFDLSTVPTQSGFQVRLWEREAGSTVRLVQLRVARGSGSPFIDFRVQDFVNDTISSLSSVPLSLAGDPDQIRLNLSYSNQAVTGSFRYLKGGLDLGALTAMAGSTTLFTLSQAVTAAFAASETAAIPVPGAAALLMPGLLVLAWFARRNRRTPS